MIGDAMDDILSPDGAAGTAPGDPGYLSHVCHQLRQPLVVAVGYISMLEDGAFGDLPAEASPVIRIVAERLDAMNALIDDLAAADAASPTE
jgi:signal transduction histidine kinase